MAKAKTAPKKKTPPRPKAKDKGPSTSTSRVRDRLLEKEAKGTQARSKAGVTPPPVGEWPEDTKTTAKKLAAEIEAKDKKKGRSQKEKKAVYDRTFGRKFDEVVYDDIQLMLYRELPKGMTKAEAEEAGENGILDTVAAQVLLGWEEEPTDVKWGSSFKFKDLDAKKIRLINNPTNRPFRKALAMRYANEILRKEWQLNGESIILDKYGRVQSGQHRLAGVIFAHQMLKDDLEKWSDYGWKDGNVFIECVVVVGIDPSPKVVDTIDIGQKRSLGDVIFRNDEFVGNEKSMAKMSNVLGHAVRLVWLRAGNAKVSDAPHFPHSEALNFMETHPKIKDCVKFISELEGGGGKEGKKISTFLSLGYASGLCYLMMTSGTDRELYDDGTEDLDFGMEEKAKDFWRHFANGAKDFPAGHAIKELRKRLSEISAGDGAGRDEIVGTVAKAFNAWNSGKTIGVGLLKLKRIVDKETDMVEITEYPRLGGLDMEVG